jgi:DNA helicase-2/ATP-dependent DNA helicase PcrA
LISYNINRIKKELFSENVVGSDVTYFEGENEYDEYIFVANKIKELIKEGYKYDDIAILYRSNFLSKGIEEELFSSNIPYHIYGGVSFYQRSEIKDMISFLRVSLNLNDEIALKRIIGIVGEGIGATTLEKINDYMKTNKLSFIKTLSLSLEDDNLP